jgi:hypothetical protein
MVLTAFMEPFACKIKALVVRRRPGLQPSEETVVAQGELI